LSAKALVLRIIVVIKSFSVSASLALLLSTSTAWAADEVKADASASATEAKHHCKVKCTDPHATCDESKKVIEILQQLITAYTHGDLETYKKYLDEDCMVIDSGKHTVISGKAQVLTRLKEHFAEHAPGGAKPLKSFHIDQPYAKVSEKGDTCVVTFVATKEVGGSNPHIERANVTDVFVKRGSDWKKLNWQGSWETVIGD
jgi:ketosteroid isomerase-like protein